MRFFIAFCALLLLGSGLQKSNAQNVTVAAAVVGNGSYATLNAAFTAINGGGQAGANINISITGNTTELVAATLNAGTWTSITISPSGGAARTIQGSLAGPIINFNGADNVTINGLNSGGNSLTISNQNTSNLASTIQFIDGAIQNTVTNCNIEGSSRGTYSNLGDGATILFATSTAATGNNNNIISNNDIRPAASNLPYQAIKSYGSAGKDNKNITIDNNLIHDFFSLVSTSNGKAILAFTNSSDWIISNNRIYQSATRTWQSSGSGTKENIYSCIDIYSGSGYVVTGNILGFSDNLGTGFTVLTNPAGNNFASMINGISLTSTTSNTNIIIGNQIAGFDLTSSRSSGATSPDENIFIGIYLRGGTASTNVTGNTIGSISSINSIILRSTALGGTSPLPAIGVYAKGNGSYLINDNKIGGISLLFTSPGTAGKDLIPLVGISNENLGATTIQNNLVGGNIANSITTSHAGGSLIGINNASATSQVKMLGNTVQNLTHTGGNTGVDFNASVIGIMERPVTGTVGNVVSGNLIYNLSNTFASATIAIHVKGLLVNPFSSSSQADTIQRNTIHSLSVSSTGTGSSVNGINLKLSNPVIAYVLNNMISLGNGISGNLRILGINQEGLAALAYHNSIRILGTASGGTDSTACYYFNTVSGIQFRSRNNIFYNERTGGSGKHYSLFTRSIPAGYLATNNLHYTTGTTFAVYNNAAVANLNALFVASSQDNPTTSKQLPVVFTSATDLHTSDLAVRNAGFNLAPVVTIDIDSTLRPVCVDIGCDEYDAGSIPGTAYTWLGSINTQWCQACNWDREAIPASTDDVIIKDDRTNYPSLQAGVGCGNVTVRNFTMQQNATPSKSASINLATYTLSVTGDVYIAGTCTCAGSTALTALTTGLIDLTGTTQSQSVDIRGADGNYPGTICKLRVNKIQPTAAPGSNHEAYLRGNLIILYNLDFLNGVLLSKTGATFDADELTANNYKTITLQSDEPGAVTRQTIAAQNTRNGFFQGRLQRKIKSGAAANEYLFPLGFRQTGGTGVLSNYFYTPALMKNSSITNNQYLTVTYLNDQNNPTADGVGIGFTGHGCLTAFEIDDQGGPTASTCNNKEIDMLSPFYWDLQESTGPAANGNPLTSPGALGAVNYDLQTAGDVYALLAQDGLTGSELRLLQRPSVVIPGNAGQGPFVTTTGTHDGVDISANTGISMYSIAAASLQGARRDGLTVFGGYASAGNGPSPLPVELLYFTAERHGESAVLCSWETASELNNDHFEVEAARERGGMLVFETIGMVQGSGTSSQKHFYGFVDEHPSVGKNYYRLRQIDYDGTAGYSKTVVVQFNTGKKFDILATSPNPFMAYPVLYLQSAEPGPMYLSVENSIGQVVYEQTVTIARGSSSLVLDLPSSLASGIYFVRATFDGEQQVGRLIKQ